MTRTVKIAPSILSADMAHLARDLERIANADYIHFDVMDGHFTGNLTFGADILRAVKRVSDVPCDVHMMVTDPDHMADWFLDAGADIVTVHWEASTHLNRTLAHIRDRGAAAGVVLNPATPVSLLEAVIEDVDMVLLMSVNPGFGGQRFIPGTLAKIRELRALANRHGVAPMIEVDGGISSRNVAEVVAAGADVIVAGSAVFGAADPTAEVELLRELGDAAARGDVRA
ncbi:MAG: ribulose-phosphate 3-epimerase [Collinsella sp.]|nr:ribulose-phosphate 3-epimerase [Collinsella sp.]